MKTFFWKLLRPDGWYFIAKDGDPVMRPAYWNGVVWEDRVEVIHAERIQRVGGPVPNPQRNPALVLADLFKDKTDMEQVNRWAAFCAQKV